MLIKMLNKAIHLVLLMPILGGLMFQSSGLGKELVYEVAVPKIALLSSNANRSAILPFDKNNLLNASEKVSTSFSELTNSVNSANRNVPHLGHVGSDSSTMLIQSHRLLCQIFYLQCDRRHSLGCGMRFWRILVRKHTNC